MKIIVREDGKWLCSWCATNGKFPEEECWRPPTEEPIKTVEDEGICHSCADNYRKGRQSQLKGKE